MTRKIVIVGNALGSDGLMLGDIVFRLAVPAALQKPNPSGASMLTDATAAETSEIQSGIVQEIRVEARVPQSIPGSVVEQQLQSRYTDAQNNLNTTAPTRPFVGASWDGATWLNMPT